MRAVLAAMLVAAASTLTGCGQGSPAPEASTAGSEAAVAMSLYSPPGEYAAYAARAYAARSAAAGVARPVPPAFERAMAEAARSAWTEQRFNAAAGSVPGAPAEVRAAAAALAAALANRNAVPDDRLGRVAEADARATLPARFGQEAVLLMQRMMAGYAAMASGRAASADPSALAVEIVRAGRAAAGDAVALDRLAMQAGGDAGMPAPTGGFLAASHAEVAVDRARRALAEMPPADARRIVTWNASPQGRARNDALMAAWARANDAAGEAMLTAAFTQARNAPGAAPAP